MKAFSPNMPTLLITDNDKSLNGNITSLQLKKLSDDVNC